MGDITILVNNAAVVHGKSLMDSDDDALLKSQHINTLGQFWVRAAPPPGSLGAGWEAGRLTGAGARAPARAHSLGRRGGWTRGGWLPHADLPACPQTTKAFLPRMLELQNGHIVCLNSVLALSAIPGAIDYCTSKASAFAFMESLTLGLLDCPGVSATTVLPFHTSTEMFQGMRVRSVSRGPASSEPGPAADGTWGGAR